MLRERPHGRDVALEDGCEWKAVQGSLTGELAHLYPILEGVLRGVDHSSKALQDTAGQKVRNKADQGTGDHLGDFPSQTQRRKADAARKISFYGIHKLVCSSPLRSLLAIG